MRNGWILAAYLLIASLLLIFRVQLISWLEADAPWYQDIFVIFFAFIIALVPALPYTIAAVVIGAKYGTVIGASINVTISVFAAIVLFAVVRYVITPESRQKASGVKGVSRLTVFTEGNAFFAILFARLLPFVPAQAVNIYASLTRMQWKPYIYATVLGKLPFVITVTLFGDRIMTNSETKEWLWIGLAYGLFLLIVLWIYRSFHLIKR